MSAGVTIYCDCQGHQVCKSSISTVEQYRDDARNNARTWGWECDERGDYAHGHTPSDTAVSEDQPKPREARRVWVDSQGGIWDGRRDRGVYFRAPEGEAPTWGPWDEINAGEYGPLSEVLADSEQVTR